MRKKHFSILAAFFMLAGAFTTVSIDDYDSGVEACMEIAYPPGSDRGTDCFTNLAYTALKSNNIDLFAQNVQSASVFYTFDDTRCHEDLHFAARKWASGQSYAGYHTIREVSLCDNALIHGFLEGFVPRANKSDLSKLANLCEVNIDYSCIDGFGHAAWSKFAHESDVKSAANMCLTFTESRSLNKCIDGLMMQMFGPADNVNAFAEYSFESLQRACGEIVSISNKLLYGCSTGIGYVLYTNLLHGVIGSGSVSGTTSYDTTLVAGLLEKTYSSCSLYSNYAPGCEDRILETFTTHFKDASFRENICKKVTDIIPRNECK